MYYRKLAFATLLIISAVLLPNVGVYADAFDELAFKQLWHRTDALVQQGNIARTWLWGPEAAASRTEVYAESPNDIRLVQYFDKSRMEINNPAAPRDQWFVSNGLIVQEMASGRIQTGDVRFEPHDRAHIPLAGDLSGNEYPPTYAGFGENEPHMQTGQRAYNLLGKPVTSIWAFDSPAGVDMDKATQYPETAHAFYDETPGLNIPGVFWTFMHQAGRVLDNGQSRTATPLFDWLYVLGHPISESYWTRVKVGGVERDVLVQLYERRVLTYTPSNPDGWKVEMGNVGQHYYQWRYATALPTTQIDCTSIEYIDPASTTGKTVQTQALAAIDALPQVAASAFDELWSIEQAGSWVMVQARVRDNEPAIFLLQQTSTTTMQVQAVWAGIATNAATIRDYFKQSAPDAPTPLIECLAPYGFVQPMP